VAVTPIDFGGDGFAGTGATNNDVIGPYYLIGGRYHLTGYSSGTFSVQLAALTRDGTNYQDLTPTATTTSAVFDLGPGKYKITCGAAMTTGNVSLVRIPYRAA
jgi:hypothetical protein